MDEDYQVKLRYQCGFHNHACVNKSFTNDFAKSLSDCGGDYLTTREPLKRNDSKVVLNSEENLPIRPQLIHSDDLLSPETKKETNKELAKFLQKFRFHVKLKHNNQNNLISMKLERCDLTSIPDFMLDLKALKYANFSRNKLSNMNNMIGKLESLEYLDVGENMIEELPATLHYLKKLKYLDVRCE